MQEPECLVKIKFKRLWTNMIIYQEISSWQMIGHLQRNKVKYIVDKVDMIHSVDSYRLAQTIETGSC